MARNQKNLLFIWTDEQRTDTLGASGNLSIRTPHVDRLAESGIFFENAYCTQPVCSPSRASIMTGVYPHTHQLFSNNQMLTREVPTIAELLGPAGYTCGYVGKWHLGNELTPQRGFEQFWRTTEDNYTEYHESVGYSTYHQFLTARGYTPPDRTTDGRTIFSRATAARLPEEVGKPAYQTQETIRFLEKYRDQPFFLSVNFLEPHMPFFGPWDGLYGADDVSLAESWYLPMDDTVPLRLRVLRERYATANPHVHTNDEAGWKNLKARYWGLCSLVDKYVGQILQRLDELGLADDTIVVYTSDHGDMMGDHRLVAKCVPYEGAIRVPLIISSSDLPARRLTTPVSQIDLVPTLLELLGQLRPDHLAGSSLVPSLQNGDHDPDTAEVVVEWHGWDGLPRELPSQSKYARGAGSRQDIGPSELRTIRRGRWKLNVHLSGEHELYDLHADPGELHNLIGDPANHEVVQTLHERLRQWQQRHADPLELPDPSALSGSP